MIKRHIINELNKWSVKKNRKPLVLRGARQVGKTTIVNEFSKKYKSYIYLNLENREHLKIFENKNSFSEVFEAIFYLSNKEKVEESILIFIDEIQYSPDAIRYLRYFYEEKPEIHVIAVGSLLETLLNRNISFPVGRVEYMALRPCSFMEYLNAIKDTASIELIESLKIPAYAHDKILNHFKRYMLIGGMPEVIANYAENRDLVQLNSIYQTLLTGFNDDVEKYSSNNSMLQYIRHILRTGFAYAGQRIKFENFGGSSYRSREMAEAFRTLEKTMLLELVYPITNTTLPISPNFKKSPKLQWLDLGLVNYAAGVQHEIFNSDEISTIWKGISSEQIIGQEILAYNTNVLYKRNFWTREEKNSVAEIDYIINFNGLIIPIEVKSGDTGRLRSLHLFMDAAPHNVAVRVYSDKFSIDTVKTLGGKEFKLINLPFYLISQLERILQSVF